MEVKSILWFRHGLRLHDNPALLEALKSKWQQKVTFYPVFIFDGESAGTKIIGYNRMKFLIESLIDLDNQLKKIAGSGLLIFCGQPAEIFRKLHKHLGIDKICFEQDCEPIWNERDTKVKNLCYELEIDYVEKVSHTLWNPLEIIDANGGFAPLTYQMMLHTVNVVGLPPRPVENADFSGISFGEIPENLHNFLGFMKEIPSPEYFSIYPDDSCSKAFLKWKGGETRALEQLKSRLKVEEEAFKNGTYLPNHGNVDLLGPPTSMSAALRFGCLSVRRFYYAVHDKFNEVQEKLTFKAPAGNHITSQLIWREYFYTMSVKNPNYGQMENNPICLNIPWNTKPKEEDVLRWKEGRTGIPIIDASMRQLKAEGWLHHTLRNIVASFLTRTGMWLNWEIGLDHFQELLLDADWSVNAGNWMWVSSSAFEQLLDSSKCSVIHLACSVDPKGDYVKRYVPELHNFPVRFIHQPWTSTIAIQEEHNVIVGKDYPSPMFDLTQAMQINCQRMKNIRDSIVEMKPHVRPSNEEEIRNFFWIADEISIKCN